MKVLPIKCHSITQTTNSQGLLNFILYTLILVSNTQWTDENDAEYELDENENNLQSMDIYNRNKTLKPRGSRYYDDLHNTSRQSVTMTYVFFISRA